MDKIRILIVEDEGLVARDIENMAVSQGYEVCGIASSGDQAIDMAAEFQPDPILMDITIKGSLDGTSVAEKVWDSYRIPLVYVTASADAHPLERAGGRARIWTKR